MDCKEVQSTCIFCGHAFSYQDHGRRKREYCSERCRRLSHKARVVALVASSGGVAKCKICGKEFKVGRSTAFCSKECRERHMSQVREAMAERMGKKKRHVACKQCGKEFDTNFMRQNFCSPRCKKDYENALRSKERERVRKEREGNPITAKCEWCGSEFTYVYNGKDRRFCSVRCIQKAYDDYAKGLRRRIRESFKGKTRLCEACGSPFTLEWRFPNKRFCSKSCQRRMWKHGKKIPSARNATVIASPKLPHDLDAYRATKQDAYFSILMTLPDSEQFAEMERWNAREHEKFMEYLYRNGCGSSGQHDEGVDFGCCEGSEEPGIRMERGSPFDEENHFE